MVVLNVQTVYYKFVYYKYYKSVFVLFHVGQSFYARVNFLFKWFIYFDILVKSFLLR